MVVYDECGLEHRIDYKKEREHYVVEVDHRFYCSCDNIKEVNEEIPAIMDACGFDYVRRI